MIYSDIHVHSTYCDGKNKPEEMVKKAIELGFESLGFSGHCYVPDAGYGMNPDSMKRYREEILGLKEKYPQLDILLGLERDVFYAPDDMEYDYVIGSLHFVNKDGNRFDVDDGADVVDENVKKYFGGDYRAYVECYYNTLKDVIKKTDADVVGHFDLVVKNNEGNKYFDEEADWYRKCALDALREIARSKPIFEVNTGAISRGYKIVPYPAKFILKEIKKLGCDVVITSDCHDADNLGFAYDKAIELVKECGLEKVKVLTKNGFEDRRV